MRRSLITAALLAGLPLGLAGAQVTTSQPVPTKVQDKAVPPVIQKSAQLPGGPTTPTLVSFGVGGNNNCASASTTDAISGFGTFGVNTTGATSGTPLGSCGAIGNDVWFYWTATVTGTTFISTCGQTSADSVIAVWADGSPAGTCPTTQILCLDDFCGLQTEVNFAATAGTSYFLEFGSYASGAPYNATFTISPPPTPPSNDGCATPNVLSGPGPYPYTSLGATTGAQGQTEAACLAYGFTDVYNDVWYTWTATFTGTARVSNCGQSSHDSRIAVYAGAGCPSGAALGCNDDVCGFQSQTDALVVSGQPYTIQIGSFGSAATGNGTFSIAQFVPSTNDDCALPTNLVGNGPHAFDTSTASTGSQGQSEGLCLAFGSMAIYNDVWFTWTASTTGTVEASLCGGTFYDSKISIYQGSGCPAPGSSIGCDDDGCGTIGAASVTCFSATSGQTYMIQIGAYGSGQFGTGQLQFTPQGPPGAACAPLDDGSSENSVGLTVGGAVCWMVGFGQGAGSTTITAIETCFGTPAFLGGYIPQGPVTVGVWDDPNDDGNISDGVLLGTTTVAVSPGSIDSDIFQSIPLGSSVTANGIFFVGAVVVHNGGEYPGPLDQSGGGGGCSAGPGSWVAGENSGTFNFTNLAANNVPPQSMTSVGIPGNWLMRAVCGPGGTPTTPFCFGDGTGTACPCGTGAAGNGCPNSVNAAGANLAATGNAIVGSDTLVLTGSGMPGTATALYFQGNAQISVVFGDGLRCVATNIVRLGTKTNAGGTSAYPAPGDLSISVRGGCSAGDVRNYQCWYRNAASFCTPATFNLTNGVNVVWQ